MVVIPQEVPIPSEFLQNLKEAKISGGGNHTIAHSAEGALYGAGLNVAGQLGCRAPSRNTFCLIEAPEQEKIVAVSCGWDFTIFLSTSFRLFGSGSNKFKQIESSCRVLAILDY